MVIVPCRERHTPELQQNYLSYPAREQVHLFPMMRSCLPFNVTITGAISESKNEQIVSIPFSFAVWAGPSAG